MALERPPAGLAKERPFAGFRIELGEIETALRGLAGVRESVVRVHEDAQGESLVAYVVTDSERPPSSRDLRRFLKERLPLHMIPSVFVAIDALPMTPSGKLDPSALPPPRAPRVEIDDDYAGARTPVEEALVEIWGQVLGVDRIGIHDYFFELGGHSLLAMKVISRVRECLGLEVSLRTLFEASTIAGFAEAISTYPGGSAERPIAPLDPESDRNGAAGSPRVG